LSYLIYAYDLEQALTLAPSDQVRVVKEITGEQVSPQGAKLILEALVDGRWSRMYSIIELQPYLRRQYDPVEILMRNYQHILRMNERLPIDFEKLRVAFEDVIQREQGKIRQMLRSHERVLRGVQLSEDESDEQYELYVDIADQFYRLFMDEDDDVDAAVYFDEIYTALPGMIRDGI
jgi:hypothetical protein